MSPDNLFIITISVALIALFYTSAGFGGGSGYVTLFSLWGISHTQIPLLALSCNILAVSIACLIAFRAGHLKLRPYSIIFAFSIPAVILGSLLPITANLFRILLAISLAFAAWRLFFCHRNSNTLHTYNSTRNFKAKRNIFITTAWRDMAPGIAMGLVSGMTGIGGGIFLAALLYLQKRGSYHEIHAATAAFILLNSSTGLAIRLIDSVVSRDVFFGALEVPYALYWIALAVIPGAMLGSYLAHHILSDRKIQLTTGLVIALAGAGFLIAVIKNLIPAGTSIL